MKKTFLTTFVSMLAIGLYAAPWVSNLSPSQGLRGQSISISFSLHNLDSQLKDVALVYCNTTDTIHFSNVVITQIGSGNDYQVSANFTIPSNAVTGTWYITWKEQMYSNWSPFGCNSQQGAFEVKALAEAPSICIVGVDSIGHNRVVWEKQINGAIKQYNIYKEDSSGQYVKIGSRLYKSFSTFTDSISNASVQASSYKLSVLDTTNNETDLSGFHTTIHLTINKGVGTSWNLIWNKYEGLAFATYNIYRGTSTDSVTLLTSVANSLISYTDLNPPAGNVFYQIEILNTGGCKPSARVAGNYSSSRSNIAFNTTTGIENIVAGVDVNISPNPFNSLVTVTGVSKIAGIKVLDITGKLLKEFAMENGSNTVTLDLSGFSKGIYFVELLEHNGKACLKKITKVE